MRVDVFYPFLFLYNVFHEEVMNEETIPLISEQHNACDSDTPSISVLWSLLTCFSEKALFLIGLYETYQLKLKSPAWLFYSGKPAVKYNLHQMDKSPEDLTEQRDIYVYHFISSL